MVPFISGKYGSTIRTEYERLAATYGADRILILNRYPSGRRELEDELAEAVRTVERPRIDILSQHAERVLERDEPTPEIFDRSRRPVFVREFLAEHEWGTDYLQKAATRDGFHADFRRFMITASHQRQPASIGDPILADLYDGVDHTGELEDLDFRVLRDGDAVQDRTELSRATTEQLFMSVRLARIRQIEPTLPVVLDDALTNFDPAHSARTIALLDELARTHQVFFLTAHPSFVELVNDHAAVSQFWWLEDGRFEGPYSEPVELSSRLTADQLTIEGE